MEVLEFEDTYLNPNEKIRDKILERIKKNEGHCPCVVQEGKNTICPCITYKESHNCHCNLYLKK